MQNTKSSVTTIKKPIVSKIVKNMLLPKINEESQVVIHCGIKGTFDGNQVRIWSTTFLIDRVSKHKSKMVHHENISLFPTWTHLKNEQQLIFTLIFSGLPKDCKHFDFIEKIPEEGGFEKLNIQRNKSDVYYVDFS